MQVSAVRHFSSVLRRSRRGSRASLPVRSWLSTSFRARRAVRSSLRLHGVSVRAVEPVAEIAQPRDDELVLVQPLIHRRREDVHVRDGAARPARSLRAPRRCRSCGCRWRRPAAADRAPPPRCRRSPASDRSSARRRRADRAAASNSTCEATAVSSSRCSPMWPTRAFGSSSSTASSMPSPARSTGTTTTPAPTRRPPAGPSGVCTETARTARRASLRPPAAG